MPITKSAKKALRVSETKRAANNQRKIRLSKALKGVNKDNINEVVSIIDKSAKTNLIHKNKAARLKSALAKKLGTDTVAPKPERKKAATAKKAVAKSKAKKTAAKKTTKK